MKKIIASVMSLLILLGSSATVNAKEVQKNPDGTINVLPYDGILEKSGDYTGVRLMGYPLVITDTEPEEDQIRKTYGTRYWVDCENPYLIYLDDEGKQTVREDFDFTISYIYDYDANKVYDYETNEELGVIRTQVNNPGPEQIVKTWYDEKLGAWVAIAQSTGSDTSNYSIGDVNSDGQVNLTDLSELNEVSAADIITDEKNEMSTDEKITDIKEIYDKINAFIIENNYSKIAKIRYQYNGDDYLTDKIQNGTAVPERVVVSIEGRGETEAYIDEVLHVISNYIIENGFSSLAETIVPIMNPVAYQIGDINCDGKIDMTDLSELSLMLIGDSEITTAKKSMSDIDGDGKLTVADLSRIKQYVSNQISSLR